MMTIDRLESKIERLIEQVRSLSFEFSDKNADHEAEESKNEALAALENYLDLAEEDWEQRPQGESSDEKDEDED